MGRQLGGCEACLWAFRARTRFDAHGMSNPQTSEIRAMTVQETDLAGWGQGTSWQFKLSRFWARHIPRAKGWFPRQIGRLFGGKMRDTIRTASGARLAMEPAS